MYVMSYFRTASEALHLAVSEDGLKWRALNGNRPILTGTVGSRTLRDPFILRAQDGRFHLLATDGWTSTSIIHAVSGDLLNWSEQEALPVMAQVPGTRNCWAPEAFYDAEEKVYRILWSSTVRPDLPAHGFQPTGEAHVTDHRIWGTATRDFVNYEPPRVFFDPGYNIIDATVARHGGA